jgi:hypothetical protein
VVLSVSTSSAAFLRILAHDRRLHTAQPNRGEGATGTGQGPMLEDGSCDFVYRPLYIVAYEVVRSMDQEVSRKFQNVKKVYDNPGCLNSEHVSGITAENIG